VIAVIVECPLPVRAARRSVDAGKPKSTRRFYIWVKRRVIAKTAFAWGESVPSWISRPDDPAATNA